MSVAVWVGREERRMQRRKNSSHYECSKEGNDQRDIIVAFLSPVKKNLWLDHLPLVLVPGRYTACCALTRQYS